MSRYIEVNDVANAIYHHIPSIRTMADARGIIEEAPSIDIVRCKECVEYDDDWCMYWQNVVNVYDYCSYGERKESE